MTKKKSKAAQVAKVAAETKVDAQDLNRLPTEALDKLDALTPDDGDLLGADPELPTDSGSNQDSVPTSGNGDVDSSVSAGESTSDSGVSGSGTTVLGQVAEDGVHTTPQETPIPGTQVEAGQGQEGDGSNVPSEPRTDDVVKDETVIGYHPVTGEPVRVCDQ